MSRSTRKNCGFTCCGKSSKEGKISYNTQNRAKTKEILREVEKTNNVELADSLTDKIDYSLPSGDNWDWETDGKRFVSDVTLHQWFLRELNNKSLYSHYKEWCQNPNDFNNQILEGIMFKSIGNSIETEEELKSVLNYQEKIILKEYKKSLSKK